MFCNVQKTIINNELAYVRFDKYPVNEGHALVLPFRHVSDFFELTEDERKAIFQLVDETKDLLDKKYHPGGYNIGINVGETAGQTVGHVHVHIIPRYVCDVDDPRGGVRWVIPRRAQYWEDD